jgi:hypothetical protein
MIGPAPSPEALAQYVEALGLGLDPETARAEIFPDHQPRVILSLVDQDHPLGPIVVGWDDCSKCSKFVPNCTCKNGPTPPPYVQKWRPHDYEKAPTKAEIARAAEVSTSAEPAPASDPDEVRAEAVMG